MEWAEWMTKGAKVYALGKPGTITKIDAIRVDGVRTVRFIYVQLYRGKFSVPYLPKDVQKRK